MEINKMMGSCGLACILCNEMLKGECEGCMDHKAEHCDIKACCRSMEISGCYECDKFPCEKKTFSNKRVCAFIKCAKELGVEGLVACLQRNNETGIKYHQADGSKGDYDKLESEAEIINLIKRGQ